MTPRGYHVTARRNAQSIMEHGLRRDWGGWDAGYVWFFDDLVLARDSKTNGNWGGSMRDNVIFELDLDGLEVVPDPHQGWGRPALDDHAFAHPGSIPPERLRLLP